jgi:hypothetical protein
MRVSAILLHGIKTIIKLNNIFSIGKAGVVVRLYGGLGNQLFSYAAAFRLAKKNNVPLFLDTCSGFIRDHNYKRKFRLCFFSISSKRSRLAEIAGIFRILFERWINKSNKNKIFENRTLIYQETIRFDERLLNICVNELKFIEGFWQSEKYFYDVADQIRSEFEFIPSLQERVNAHLPELSIENAIAIHVRNFNDTYHPNKGNIDDIYYSKAIQFYKDKITHPHFFVFSDNPNLAIQRCALTGENFTIVNNFRLPEGELGELYFMSLFRYFIIANSTFSWWGAWLSTQNDKIVIAPGEVVDSGEGCWGFEGLIPLNWITI